MALHPTTDLVAVAWISSIPDIPAGSCATSMPNQEDWPVGPDGISRFITARVVGGTPMTGTAPVAHPVLEISAWATKVGTNKPPWHAAAQLCEIIRIASYGRTLGVFGRPLTFSPGGRQYATATVTGVMLHTEPRRMYADPRNYAHYQFDAGMFWKEAGLLIP
jgi:hypothetical protein